jgi:hypothetical protein
MSGKMDGAEDAVMLAAEIVGNEAMAMLNLASNNIGQPTLPEGWSDNGSGWGDSQRYEHADGTYAHVSSPPEGSTFHGVIAVANAIKDMGALTSLDISNQVDRYIGAEHRCERAKHLAGALKDHA